MKKGMSSLGTLILLAGAVALVAIFAVPALAADVISDFNDGTLQGWTPVGETLGIVPQATGGNPGGYVRFLDKTTGVPCWMVAPSQYLGDWRGMASVAVDLVTFVGTRQWSTVKIQISGPGGSYTRVFSSRPGSAWGAFQTDLNESLWVKSSGSWDALLGNVTDFRILLEFISGYEEEGMDNVRLIERIAPPPPPPPVPDTTTIISDFNSGGLGGWTPVGDTIGVSAQATGGNPDGYIRFLDKTSGVPCWMVAPNQYLGNWHGKTLVAADLVNFVGTSLWSTAKFQISGPGGTYLCVFSKKPSNQWSTFQTDIVESKWTRVSGSWNALLDNVTDFRILLEFINGYEENGLDNVRLVTGLSVVSIGQAKQMSDGSLVQLQGVVSRFIGDCVYIQSEDNSAGIRLDGSLGVTEGDLLTVTGKLSTDHEERFLAGVVLLESIPGTLPTPLPIAIEDVGGVGASNNDPALGESSTPKETGLLVTTSGTVTATDLSGQFRITNAGGNQDVAVICSPDMACPAMGSKVQVTGISSNDGNDPASPAIRMARDETQYLSLPLGSNLIRNPGSEEGGSGINGALVTPIPGWIPTSSFTVTNYGYIYQPTESVRINGGGSFFFGGLKTAQSQATQDIDVSSLASLIDGKKLAATVSAYMGGRDSEGDRGYFYATFYNAAGTSLSMTTLGPQTSSKNAWVYRERIVSVPAGTRRIQVKMSGTRYNGKNNDQFFDNLSLIIKMK